MARFFDEKSLSTGDRIVCSGSFLLEVPRVLNLTQRAAALVPLFAVPFGLLGLAAVGGCGGSSSIKPTDAGAAGGSGGGSVVGTPDAATDTMTGGMPDATMVATTCPTPPAVTPAPADTATPPAATGPYLWKNVNITAGGFVSGIVFSPAQKDVVYARTDIGGAYRWNAAAKRWMPLLDWVTRANANWGGVESIAVDPRDANKVYVAAGTYLNSTNTAILRSNDQGRTFTATTMTLPMGGNADGRSVGERLMVDPNHPSTLYFGSRTMGIWKSTDSAATWTRLSVVPGRGDDAEHRRHRVRRARPAVVRHRRPDHGLRRARRDRACRSTAPTTAARPGPRSPGSRRRCCPATPRSAPAASSTSPTAAAPATTATAPTTSPPARSSGWTSPAAPGPTSRPARRRRWSRSATPASASTAPAPTPSWSARSIAGASATRSSAPPTGARPGRRSTPRARRTTSRPCRG